MKHPRIVVVGGGIHGAGIAAEAARCGWEVSLFEKNDFGSGTSWASSKLIHGGLRYLEFGDVRLVRESLRERQFLLDHCSPNVHPLEFVIAVQKGFRRSSWQIRAGMSLYDMLSFDKTLPKHRVLKNNELFEKFPGLNVPSLKTAVSYYDAQCNFPERLVITLLRHAEKAGARVYNYHAVEKLLVHQKKVIGVRVRDVLRGHEFEVPADVVVNAAGPSVDELLRDRIADPLVQGTRGSHIFLHNDAGIRSALYAEAKADGRPFFVLPWLDYIMVGTTDIMHQSLSEPAVPTRNEITYLMEEFSILFPDCRLSENDILWSFAGIRPLPAGPKAVPGAISRRHTLVRHRKKDGMAGLISLIGGKLTSFRTACKDAVRAANQEGAFSPVHRESESFAGSRGEYADMLYGAFADEIRGEMEKSNRVGVSRDTWAQVSYAVRHEWAKTIADIFFRRTSIGYSPDLGERVVNETALFLKPLLGWADADVEKQKAAYRSFVRTRLQSHLDHPRDEE